MRRETHVARLTRGCTRRRPCWTELVRNIREAAAGESRPLDA